MVFLMGCTASPTPYIPVTSFTPPAMIVSTPTDTLLPTPVFSRSATQDVATETLQPLDPSSQIWMGPIPTGARARLGKGAIRDMEVSPDGESLAIATDVAVYLVDRDKDSQKWIYPVDGSVRKIEFSKKRDFLAVAYGSGDIILLSIDNGAVLQTYKHAQRKVFYDFAISPEGDVLVLCYVDGVEVWHMDRISEADGLPPELSRPRSVAFSPDGKMIAFGYSREIILVDRYSMSIIANVKDNIGRVEKISFSPDGKYFLGFENSGIIKLWNVETRELLWAKEEFPHEGDFDAAFSDSGEILAISSDVQPILFLNVNTGVTLQEIENSEGMGIVAIAFFKSGQSLFAASRSSLYEFSVPNGVLLSRLMGYGEEVTDLLFSPDGKTLVVVDGTLSFWGMQNLERLDIEKSEESIPGYRASISPDGIYLAVSEKNNIHVFSYPELTPLQTMESKSDWVNSLAFSPDGYKLACISGGRFLTVWNVGTWDELYTIEIDPQDVAFMSMDFSPDGKILALGGVKRSVVFLDASDGQEVDTMPAVPEIGAYHGVAFSPDGAYFAAMYHDCTVMVWELSGGRMILNWKICDGVAMVHAEVMAFTDDGQLVVGCEHGEMAVVNNLQKRSLAWLKGHNGNIRIVRIAPDGETIVSGSRDGSVVVWLPITVHE